MKKLLSTTLFLAAALCMRAQPSPVLPSPATQAQVNAGIDKIHFVTPLTLANFAGVYTYSPYYNATPDSGTVINVANIFSVDTLSTSPTTFTFSGAPANNYQSWQRLFKNPTASAVTVNVPSAYSFNAGGTATSFVVQPTSDEWIYWSWDGTTYYIWGDPQLITVLPHKTSPVSADSVAILDSATSTMKYATLGSLPAGGLGDPGSNGIVVRTAVNTTQAAQGTSYNIRPLSFHCYPGGTTSSAITSTSAGWLGHPGACSVGFDATYFTQARIIVTLSGSGSNSTTSFLLRYYGSSTDTWSNYIQAGASADVLVGLNLAIRTCYVGAWTTLAPGAQADNFWSIGCVDTANGSLTPSVAEMMVEFR